MGLAVFLTLWLGRGWRWMALVLFSWAVLHSYSRIYLGLHYPSDILAGWLCGAFFAILFYACAKKLLRNETQMPSPA
jgi:undecaprenyl-diphosphatase